jgi:hypothetical protein
MTGLLLRFMYGKKTAVYSYDLPCYRSKGTNLYPHLR